MSLNGPFFIDRHLAIKREMRGFQVKLFKLATMFAIQTTGALIAAQQQKIDRRFLLFIEATMLRKHTFNAEASD